MGLRFCFSEELTEPIQRHLGMKPRTQFFLAIILVLLLLGTVIFFSGRDPEPGRNFPATINRDCAPWDGSAFTVSIPYESGVAITISIWQSPDLLFPTTFSFPDETGQIGSVNVQPKLEPLEPLRGRVTFQRVEEGMPVEGRFSLSSESGVQFDGAFRAEWGNLTAYCG